MSRRWRAGILTLIVLLCASSDQVTKAIARANLSQSAPVSLLDGLIHLQYTENGGAFLGMGAGLPDAIRTPLAVGLSALFTVVVAVLAVQPHGINPPQLVSLSLMAGGGAGNVIDRVWNSGAVVDFCTLSIGPLHTGIFNLADIAITTGAVALMLLGFGYNLGVTREDAPADNPRS